MVEWKNMLHQRVAQASVNTYLRTMRTLFNLAGRLGLHHPNPFQDVSYVPEYNKLKHTAEHVEIINLLGMIQQFPTDNRPEWFWASVVKVLYYTGMRRRQLVELCWGILISGLSESCCGQKAAKRGVNGISQWWMRLPKRYS